MESSLMWVKLELARHNPTAAAAFSVNKVPSRM
jgi:hypothetical protein